MIGTLRKRVAFALWVACALCVSVSALAEPSVKKTMDGIVTRFYANLNEEALSALTQESVLGLITNEERQVLATNYWTFDVNVPVVVSLVRNVDQAVTPFWIAPAGFTKTDLVVTNELPRTYEVWQKEYDAGRVELGINGFDRHLAPYFVCVGPQTPGVKVEVTHLVPQDGAIIEMKKGAWTYRDWDDLYLAEVPKALEGQLLLTTCRGRAWEAHLVGAFRKTPFPSSARPDQVVLTWSRDPRTTQTVQWRTNTEVSHGVVRYRAKEADGAYRTLRAECGVIEDRLLMNDRYMHHYTAVLRGLKPATTYTYSVGSPDNDAWSAEAEFTTAPDRETPFSFVYFGDTHRSPDWGHLLHTADARFPETAFYLIAGDVVSTGLFRDDWDQFFDYSSGVFNRKPVAFALGNHDEPNGLGAWMPLALTAFPENGPKGVEAERNYSFRYGNALFFVMDVETLPEVQAEWFEQVLAHSDATWKIGMFHFPLYSLEGDDEYKAIRQRWEQVFVKYHVDLMLHGHVHYYLRTRPMMNGHAVDSPADGAIYLISLGLPDKEPPLKETAFAEKYLNGGPWYQKLDINDKHLVYRAYDKDGQVCDEMSIEK